MLDLALAIGHHLLIFALFGVLAAEFVVVRPGVTPGLDRADRAGRPLVRRPGGADPGGGLQPRRLRRQGLALLFAQRLLLGEDRHVRAGRAALGPADDRLHPLAQAGRAAGRRAGPRGAPADCGRRWSSSRCCRPSRRPWRAATASSARRGDPWRAKGSARSQPGKHPPMRRAAIVSPDPHRRSASSRAALAPMTAGELGAVILRALVERTRIDPAVVDDVIFAQGYGNGEAPCIARWAALAADFPIEIPGYQLDRRCGSRPAGGDRRGDDGADRRGRRGGGRRRREHEQRRILHHSTCAAAPGPAR